VHICEAEAGKSRQVLKKRAAEGMGGGGGGGLGGRVFFWGYL
jgi:hypothetical protein